MKKSAAIFLAALALCLSVIAIMDTPQLTTEIQIINGEGAVCEDGNVSISTGRGTCSHHGGVKEWLDGR